MEAATPSILDTLLQLVALLWQLLGQVLGLLLVWSLSLVWLAWWLGAVNWHKAWTVLAQGAWVPLVLLLVISAAVWANIAPQPCECLGFVTVPNFWWQLGAVGLLFGSALFCGWLQGLLGWTPATLDLTPPAPAHAHHHSHH